MLQPEQSLHPSAVWRGLAIAIQLGCESPRPSTTSDANDVLKHQGQLEPPPSTNTQGNARASAMFLSLQWCAVKVKVTPLVISNSQTATAKPTQARGLLQCWGGALAAYDDADDAPDKNPPAPMDPEAADGAPPLVVASEEEEAVAVVPPLSPLLGASHTPHDRGAPKLLRRVSSTSKKEVFLLSCGVKAHVELYCE